MAEKEIDQVMNSGIAEGLRNQAKADSDDPNAVSLQVVPYMEDELGCGQPRPPLDADGSYKYYRVGRCRPIRVTVNHADLVSCVESPYCVKADGFPGGLRVEFGSDGVLLRELRTGTKLLPISKEEFIDLYENYLSNMESLSIKPLVSLPPEADGNYEYYCFAGFRPIRASLTEYKTVYLAEAPSYENGGTLRSDPNLSRILWKEEQLESISREEFVRMCKNYMGYMTIRKALRNMRKEKTSHILPQEADINLKYYCMDGQHPIKIVFDEKWNAIGADAPSYKHFGESWITQLFKDIENVEEIAPISEERFTEMCA